MGGLVCAVHRRKNKGFPTLKRTLNLGIEKGRLLKNSRPKGGLIQVICYPASPETVDITGFFEKFCIAIRTTQKFPLPLRSALRRKLRRTGNFFVFRGEPASLGFAARRWGASAELPFGFSVRGSADIYSVSLLHVVVNCMSFATTFFQKVTSHSFRRSSSPNATRCAGPGPKEIRVHR